VAPVDGKGMMAPASPLPPWRIVATLADTPVSRTFRVTAGGRCAVLRVDEAGARRLGLDRSAEPGVLSSAANAGLGPSVIHADAGRGLLLTDWLPGRAWSAADLREAGNLERAALLLRRVHALPLAAPAVDLGEAINRYATLAGPPRGDVATAAHRLLERSIAAAGGRRCFCHNDPTPGNFIAAANGELRLIDWEYAGLCYPGFDLAALAVGAGLGGDPARRLLGAYLGREPTPGESEQHRDWEALYRLVSDLWLDAVQYGLSAG
jgi:thiamine kinase-like enzyme